MKKITPLSTLNFPFSNSRGFTLVELLVSISIIAVLTALLTANFVGARQRGRDGQRKANAYNMQSALELYRADVGTYPLTLTGCGTALKSPTGTTYMQKLPSSEPNYPTRKHEW
jgi:prepilin-type N-terminal cleavage/methylation domain-containing protein